MWVDLGASTLHSPERFPRNHGFVPLGVPGPLPPGLDFQLVIAVQTDAATLSFLNDAGDADIGYDAVKRITRLRCFLPDGTTAFVDRGYTYNRTDCRGLAKTWPKGQAFLLLLDLPFSFAADTILFPFVLGLVSLREALGDQTV